MAKILTGRAQQLFQEALRSQLQGKFDAAIKTYQRVLQTNPKHADTLANLGSIHYQRGGMDLAHTLLLRAVKADPRNGFAQGLLGNVLFGRGEIDASIRAYRAALDVKADDFGNLFNLGNVLAQQGMLDEAAREYEAARKLRPKQAPLLVNLGNVRRMQGQLDEARTLFEDVLKIDPGDVHARVNIGNILCMNGEVAAAIDMLGALVRDKPKEPLGHIALGTAHEDNGDYKSALACYEEAVAVDPANSDALRRRANALFMLNRVDEAIAAFEAILARDPADILADRNLRRARRRNFPAWHLQLLRDSERNRRFDAAIRQAVGSDDLVLDIGSGSGLLAMMAVRAGAADVVACEMNSLITPVARRVLADNSMDDRITLIESKSTALRVGQELPRPADVILAEVVDAGLLGEGILPTMRHAVSQLAAENARLIPSAARIYCALVRAPGLRLVNPVAQVEGFNLAAFDAFRIPWEYVGIDARREPCQLLSPVVEALTFDFYHPPASPAMAAGHQYDLQFEPLEDAACDGVMFWFELDLGAGLTLNSGPDGDDVHWGQALFFFEEELQLSAGVPQHVRLHHSDTQIWFTLPQPATAK